MRSHEEVWALLEVKGLTVSTGGKSILKDVSLDVRVGEAVVLFGPNASGKSTLLQTIMGLPAYEAEAGTIVFNGRDITALPIDERARLGIGLAFQRPPAVRGVRLGELVRISSEKNRASASGCDSLARRLDLEGLLERDVNLGFSGGEAKRSELLQLAAQNASFLMLDEPDSGVDLVNIGLIGEVINEMLQTSADAAHRTRSGLIITHAGHILDYVKADRAFVMLEGTILCSGPPQDILRRIRDKGYGGCVSCVS